MPESIGFGPMRAGSIVSYDFTHVELQFRAAGPTRRRNVLRELSAPLLSVQPHRPPPEGCFQSGFLPSVTMTVRQCSSTRSRRRVLSHPKATSPARHARYRSTTRRRRRNIRPQSRWDVMLPSLSPHKAASTTRALGPGLVVFPSTSSATRRLLRRSASTPPAASVVLRTPPIRRRVLRAGFCPPSGSVPRRPVNPKADVLPWARTAMSWLGCRFPCPTRRSNAVAGSRPHSVGSASVDCFASPEGDTRQSTRDVLNHPIISPK
jgi:hypothetical protein